MATTRPGIEDIRSLGDFATTYQWYLQFIKTPPVTTSVNSDDLNLRCISADVPKMTGTSMELSIRGHKVKHPGLYSYSGTVVLTFSETVDNKITLFLQEWRELCWQTRTGVMQKPKAELESIVRLTRLNRQDQPIWEFELFGCYLEDYDPGGQLVDATADIIKPTLTLSYDYFVDQSAR